jgi:hypothetical protein
VEGGKTYYLSKKTTEKGIIFFKKRLNYFWAAQDGQGAGMGVEQAVFTTGLPFGLFETVFLNLK